MDKGQYFQQKMLKKLDIHMQKEWSYLHHEKKLTQNQSKP